MDKILKAIAEIAAVIKDAKVDKVEIGALLRAIGKIFDGAADLADSLIK